MISKKASESLIIMNNLVLPANTNGFGNLMGGQLVNWMDIAGALSASKHCNEKCMTVAIDNLTFKSPIILGDMVHIESKVSRAFNTSMEIHIYVWGEKLITGKRYDTNEAFFTFVALNDFNKPIKVPALIPETTEEIALFDSALERRNFRLNKERL